eukprot:353141-Chlamydomonas_euryale.AAC.5
MPPSGMDASSACLRALKVCKPSVHLRCCCGPVVESSIALEASKFPCEQGSPVSATADFDRVGACGMRDMAPVDLKEAVQFLRASMQTRLLKTARHTGVAVSDVL